MPLLGVVREPQHDAPDAEEHEGERRSSSVRGGELDAVGEGEAEDPVRFRAGRAGAIWERERAAARGQVGRFWIWDLG